MWGNLLFSTATALFMATSYAGGAKNYDTSNAIVGSNNFQYRIRDVSSNILISKTKLAHANKQNGTIYNAEYHIRDDFIVDFDRSIIYFYDENGKSGFIVKCNYREDRCTKSATDVEFYKFAVDNNKYILLSSANGPHGPIASKLLITDSDAIVDSHNYDKLGIDQIVTDFVLKKIAVNVAFHLDYIISNNDAYYVRPELLGVHWWLNGTLSQASFPLGRITKCVYFALSGDNWLCIVSRNRELFESFYCCKNHVLESTFIKTATLPVLRKGSLSYEDMRSELHEIEIFPLE